MAVFPAAPVAIDELLGGVARGLQAAQEQMDRAAFSAVEQSVVLPQGEVRLRPLWFVFQKTTLDLEFSTVTAELRVRPLDPLAVALRGRTAAVGARLHVEIAPAGAAVIARDSEEH